VKPGKNLLVVAVLNTNGPGGFCGDPRNMLLRSTAHTNRVALSGTWKAKAAVALPEIAIPFPHPKLGYYKTITAMDNGMIAPLMPFAIKGAIRYQGEASWPFWLQYRRLLPALIADWRDGFQVGPFPFLIVSLSTQSDKQKHPTEPGYAELREAQWRTARTVTNAGLAIAADLGDEPISNIHPKNKQEVGRRLSLVARRLVYGEKDLLDSGPEFVDMMLERKNADPDPATVSSNAPPFVKEYKTRLYFKHLGSGLVFKPGNTKPNGFAVAGEDKQFVWADAKIEGDTVVVSAPDVPVPRYVRYGWAYNPIITLFNKEGLPAIPFRTDE
jgi:sialate O-acetylesterase